MESIIFGDPPLSEGGDWTGVIRLVEADLGDSSMFKAQLTPWLHDALLLGWNQGGDCRHWTLYHWEIACTEPLCLRPGAMSAALPRDLALKKFSSLVIELCAGSGSMGLAASFAGAEVAVSIDVSTYAADHLRGNSHGVVIEASLEDLQTIFETHLRLGSRSATAFLGFPCQPFSAQGYQRAELDPRFNTLLFALRAAWLLPVQALIAECVPAAGQNEFVLRAFKLLNDARGWEQIQYELDLKMQWPMKRLRWWCLCAPACWLAGPFCPWPTEQTYSTIGSLLPVWPAWDVDEETDLLLTEHEHRTFGDETYGDDQRWFGPQHSLPTLLHSYGTWFTACPCGCRDTAMSEASLRSRGVRGFCVTSTLTGQPRLLHPAEGLHDLHARAKGLTPTPGQRGLTVTSFVGLLAASFPCPQDVA